MMQRSNSNVQGAYRPGQPAFSYRGNGFTMRQRPNPTTEGGFPPPPAAPAPPSGPTRPPDPPSVVARRERARLSALVRDPRLTNYDSKTALREFTQNVEAAITAWNAWLESRQANSPLGIFSRQ